jgi:hypothetical protein
MKEQNEIKLQTSLLYQGKEGAVTAEFLIDGENQTLWATQKTMGMIFGVNRQAVTKHLQNIFSERELEENSVCSKMEHTASDGKRYLTKFYNLDAIISVGYRVNSKEATQFRIWASSILKEYIVKGYVLDKDLLKNGSRFGKDYFDRLLEEIKEIIASERRFYQKVTDIYATSYDYNPKAKISQDFFKKVQNKLHYAVSKQTAPEIIAKRANSKKPNMGLTSWDTAPNGKILLKDALIAKNYLSKEEITELDEIVSMYLDYATNQARRHNPMAMKDWANRLDKFLDFNEYDILKDKGKISRSKVDKLVKKEYNNYRKIQDKNYNSDFDNFLKESEKLIK